MVNGTVWWIRKLSVFKRVEHTSATEPMVTDRKYSANGMLWNVRMGNLFRVRA